MKKALSGVIAASLVMSSFASAAFAAETTEAPKTPKTPEEMFEVLKTAGVFEGFEDGTAGLDKSMTRAQVAKVLVKLLKLEENKAGASVYQDLDGAGWAEGFIGAATKAGIMDGVADGKFDPSGTFTTEQLAAVLVRALKLPLSTEAAEGVVADWAKAYVATAVKAGLITKTADYTKPALRSVLVSSSFAAKGELDKPVVVPQAITAEIKGYETVLVKFGAAADTSKVKFELKKGTTTKAHKVTWNEAKTEATLALDSKLTEGEYGLSVTGASEAAYTQTFKVEAEKVVSIKFDSDKAPLARYNKDDVANKIDAGDVNDSTVTLTYTVLNQYGEDITGKTDVDVDVDDNDLTFVDDDGELTISFEDDDKDGKPDDEFDINDTFSVTLEYEGDDGDVRVNQKFTVAEAGYVAKVSNLKLYNEDDETLDTGTKLSEDKFYVTFEAADQYGNDIDPEDYMLARKDLRATTSDNDVVDVDEEEIVKIEVDGEDVLALPLTNSEIEEGKTTITIASKETQDKQTIDITAKETDKVATFTLSTPEIVVAGEENVIPFTALDTEGNEITDLDVLNNKDDVDGDGKFDNWDEWLSLDVKGKGLKVKPFNFEKNAAGKIELILDLRGFELDGKDDEEDSLTDSVEATIEATTFTEKDVSFDIKIKEKAVPLEIVDVNSEEGALAVNGDKEAVASTSFERGDVVVVDQYDRKEELDDGKFDNYELVIIDNGDKYAQVSPNGDEWAIAVVGTDTGKAEFEFALQEKKGKEALDSKYLEKVTIGTEEVTIIEDSNYDFTLSVVDVDDIVGYNVEEFTELYATTMNDETALPYAKELEVVGLLKDGTEVALPASGYSEYYTVSIPDELKFIESFEYVADGKDVTVSNAVYADSRALDKVTGYDLDTNDKTDANIEVNVIGKTSSGTKEYTRKIAVGTYDPKVVTQALDDDNAVSKEGDGVVSIDHADYINAATYDKKIAKVVEDAVKSTDQYGFEVLEGKQKNGRKLGKELAASGGVVFTNLTDKDRDQQEEVIAGDDLSITVTAPSGKKFTFKLHIN